MEKSGKIQFTPEEFSLFNQGVVPSSISSKWGNISWLELSSMVESGNYEIIPRDTTPEK